MGLGALVVGSAAAFGLRAEELGLARRHVAAGVRDGLAATAVVLGGLVLASVTPAAGWFDDPRADISAAELAWRALVVIPVGTVLVEELTFRGALHGLLARRWGARTAVVAGAALFGLWHLAPVRHDGTGAILGTLVATTAAGVAFGWLRTRSGSVVAPMLAHAATNSGALVVAWSLSR